MASLSNSIEATAANGNALLPPTATLGYRSSRRKRKIAPVQDANICASRSTASRRRKPNVRFDADVGVPKKNTHRKKDNSNDCTAAAASTSSGNDKTANSEGVTCEECGKVLKNQSSLNTHRNYIHGTLVRATLNCPEPNCPTRTTTMNSLIAHLTEHHGYPLKRTFKNFASMDDFLEWYNELISDGSVEFSKSSGMKSSRKSQNQTYYCTVTNRRPRDLDVVRTTCPAYIRISVDKEDGSVKAELQLSHLGHECQPKYSTLADCPSLATAYDTVERKLQNASRIFETRFSSMLDMEQHPTVQLAVDMLNKMATSLEQFEALFSSESSFPSGYQQDEADISQLAEPVIIEDFATFVRSHPDPSSTRNFQFRCQLCDIVLPNYNEFMMHRTNVHQIVQWRSNFQTDTSDDNFDRSQLCEICSKNFETTPKPDVWFCEICSLIFHRNCKDGHALICKGPDEDEEGANSVSHDPSQIPDQLVDVRSEDYFQVV